MEIVILLLLLIQGTVVGLLCSYVAEQKHRSKFNWFILGFFFSLLALVALAAIPALQSGSAAPPQSNQRMSHPQPQQNTDTAQVFFGPRNLDDDAYKIWLVERFNITRNDALGGLICNKKLFQTIEDALSYAHEAYSQEVALHASASLLPDALSNDAETAQHLGITYAEDRYLWNGNHFKSITKAIEFAKLHQADFPAPIRSAGPPTKTVQAISAENVSSLLHLHGIKYEEERFVWQGNHFKKAADAIAYAERNRST
jgi:hypothetical protein